MHKILLAFVLLYCPVLVSAQSGAPAALTPQLEAHAFTLSQQLRCLVCQNQTLADSQAGLADDLKKQIRLQLAAGKSDQQVIDFMVERYGDFVRYKPPFKATTWLLWIGPFVLLVAGLAGFVYRLRARRSMPDMPDSAQLQRAAELLVSDPVHRGK